VAITAIGTAGTDGGSLATITPTWPSGLQAGDVALLFWSMSTTSTPTAGSPTGFTQHTTLDGASGGSLRVYLYRKICAGTESGTLSCAVSTGATRQSACLVVYRGLDTTTPIDAIAVDANHTGETTTHNNPQVTGATTGAAIACSIHERATSGDTNWTAPTGYTERADTLTLATGTGGTITAVADLFTAQTAGANVTPPVWTGTGFSTTNIVTYTLALRPAAAPAAPPPVMPARRIQHLLVR
jgi:hypothetical protein